MSLDPQYRKQLQAKCRRLLEEYQDVVGFIQGDVLKELEHPIDGIDAFAYAKKAIRNEGIKEGIRLFIQKINKYASEQ